MDLTQQPNQPKSEPAVMSNQSKVGEMVPMPEEAKGLSWAGFFLSWIWGVFNGAWLSLLVFIIPFWHFVLLFKGREWAWKGKKWASVEEFKNTQKNWAIAGLVINLIMIPIIVIFYGIMMAAILSTVNPALQMEKARQMREGQEVPKGNVIPLMEKFEESQ